MSLTNEFFTTKNAKDTKDSETMILNFVLFVLLWLRVFGACANFSPIPNCLVKK
jgi:hypothetical protein